MSKNKVIVWNQNGLILFHANIQSILTIFGQYISLIKEQIFSLQNYKNKLCCHNFIQITEQKMRVENQSEDIDRQQTFKTIKIGISQHIIAKDIEKCHWMAINHHNTQGCTYAILTNHQIVYLFNHTFNLDQGKLGNNNLLSDECKSKINLRMQYKLPPLLHIKMAYSYNSECIFTILNNGKIATFTEELYYIGTVDIVCIDPQNSIKHCLDFQYFQKQSTRESRKIKIGYFTFLFTDNIQLQEVQIASNHKLSKFKPSYKVNLLQLNKCILDSSIRHPDSIKGFYFFRSHLFNKQNEKFNIHMVLSCNCKDFVVFYFINKITMIKEETVRITKSQLQGLKVGDSEISIVNKRFFLGMNDGTIKAISFKQENVNVVLYSIKICSASIIKLFLQENEKIFAFAKDNHLYLINLHNLSVQQRFKLGQTSYFTFINQKYFLTVGHMTSSNLSSLKSQQQQQQFIKSLFLIQFNCNYRKICDVNSQILQHIVYKKSELVHYSDHSLLINDIIQQNKHIQTYLPPRALSVRCIAKNMFVEDDEYWILTDKSEIYKYKVNQGSIVISEIIELYRFLDYFGIEHRYIVTYFCFLTKIIPMIYDSQTTLKQYQRNNLKNQQVHPICFGTKTGEILIVSIHKILNILFRIKSLSTTITNILQIHPIYPASLSGVIIYQSKKSQKIFIISVSNSTIPSQLFRLDNKNSKIKSLNNQIFVIYQKRTFSCYYCKDQQNQGISLFRQEHYNVGFHQISTITTINLILNNDKNCIVVGSSLGQIFVYIVHKEINKEVYLYLNLLYVVEISKEEPIKYLRIRDKCLIINLGDNIVGFQLQQFQEIIQQTSILPNIKIKTINYQKQFSLTQKITKISHHVSPQKPHNLLSYMPQIDKLKFPRLTNPTINRQKRSLSSSLIRAQKPQFLFHFPDIQLYRSLINKKYIN